jgi:amylosucrase
MRETEIHNRAILRVANEYGDSQVSFVKERTHPQVDLNERLARHWPSVSSRFHSLYENHVGQAERLALLERFQRVVLDAAFERAPALRARDALTSAQPDWFLQQNQLGYIAYVDRFGKHDPLRGHGTLAGVIDRIPHLKSLGVTYLHLLPFTLARAGENDGGFAVASFTDVDPRLGTNDDLRRLTQALADAGMVLCADMVLNHVADDHPWALAARAGDSSARRRFHILDAHQTVDSFEANLGQVFPQTAPGNFTFVPELNGWVWTTFFPYQWDLNYSNPDVLIDVVEAMLALANQGVGAFRLDSTAFLWKRMGTACVNLPEVHRLLQIVRAVFEIAAPSVLLKAEAIMARRDLPAYLGADADAPECHLAYQSAAMAATWLALSEGDATLLSKVLQTSDAMPALTTWATYLRCHDDIVWGVLKPEFESDDAARSRLVAASEFYSARSTSFARGETFQSGAAGGVHGSNGMLAALVGLCDADGVLNPSGLDRWSLLFAVMLASNGLPLIYMGDELGLDNVTASESSTLSASEDGRALHRPRFDERALARALHDPHSAQAVTLSRLKSMLSTRARLDALAAETPLTVLSTSNQLHRSVLAFSRGPNFVLLANFSSEAAAALIDCLPGDGVWTDALTGECFDPSQSIPAWRCYWLVAE